MVTAVIAAPVPPPTMAAMPTMAKVGTLMPATGWTAVTKRAERAAQRRAHEQRRRENSARGARAEAERGREQLGGEQQRQQRRQREVAGQDRLDGRIADAFDVIVPGRAQQRVNQRADAQHADGMTQIADYDPVEDVLGKAAGRG